jgi:hypothetical protein
MRPSAQRAGRGGAGAQLAQGGGAQPGHATAGAQL